MFEKLWTDKYRPNKLSDITGNDEILLRLKLIASTKNLPNMIFSGMSGTGKTSSAICLVKEIYGNNYSHNVIELNATDDLRKIDVVKRQIDIFAKTKKGIKVVIFDEADSMTKQVQHTLRSIIDKYYTTTRFILICNSLSNIIDTLQSRCMTVKYSLLTKPEMYKRLLYVINMENIKYEESGLDAIYFCSKGDMRMALNCLQTVSINFGYVTGGNVYKITDIPHPNRIQKLLDFCLNSDIISAINLVQEIYQNGYSPIDIIETLEKLCTGQNMTDSYKKIKYIQCIANTHIRIAKGLTTFNQITGIIAQLCRIES